MIPDLSVETLGEPGLESPLDGFDFVQEEDRVLLDDSVLSLTQPGESLPSFERAGSRSRIDFDPDAAWSHAEASAPASTT